MGWLMTGKGQGLFVILVRRFQAVSGPLNRKNRPKTRFLPVRLAFCTAVVRVLPMLPSTPYAPAPGASPLSRPLLAGTVQAGFPSPADDYMERSLDLNEELIHRPHATFFSGPPGTPWSGRASTAIC